MGGVLTLTSYPRRTSPVLRGKWVLEQILGTPPPPPPPMVNTQKVERRRAAAPFGSASRSIAKILSAPDATPAWIHSALAWKTSMRSAHGGPKSMVSAVDASGRLVTGEDFTGPAELKKLLLERKGRVPAQSHREDAGLCARPRD